MGDYVGQLRTLKVALESRLKARMSSSHPVMQWLVEHTAFVLNSYALGSDGKTPYGRLHGREGRERMCEFGERIQWYVPKKMRSKLDQRWRYGIFLGRSMSSDQNFIGLANGDVVCARAIVRLVPSVRWDMSRIAAITVSPFEFKSKNQDLIETDAEPHTHPEAKPSELDDKISRRLKSSMPISRPSDTPRDVLAATWSREDKWFEPEVLDIMKRAEIDITKQ